MSYVRSGMGTNGETLVATREVAPAPVEREVRAAPEQPSDIERTGLLMGQLASYLAPNRLAQVWPFTIPILAIPAVSGAFGGGDGHRLGGAAYGLVTGVGTAIVGYPLLVLVTTHIGRQRQALLGSGYLPFFIAAGALAVPAYFTGKRAKGGAR
jgi:hypothetical protein